jgi:release factor glutamine methyltransferase
MSSSHFIAPALDWASAALAARGVEEARLDAELLLAHVLHIRRSELRLRLRDELASADFTAFAQLVERRLQREPLPYIVGTQEFMGLSFRVTPDVLIPRPETERLVETVLGSGFWVLGKSPKPKTQNPKPILADIGTGSGIIAVSLAHFLPDARVYATDISASALRVAQNNAKRLGVCERITFAQGDSLEPLRRLGLQGQLHAIVTNPPYIPSSDVDSLQPEVSRYEPRAALDGGAEGLTFYRRLADESAEFLRPDGFIACEVGIGQSRVVCKLFRQANFTRLDFIQDYSGVERVVVARVSLWR